MSFLCDSVFMFSSFDVCLNFESEQCAQEFPSVSNDHRVRQKRTQFFEFVLNGKRSDVLASCCDDDLLDSPCDVQESFLVNESEIS